MIQEELKDIIRKYDIPERAMKTYQDYIENLESINHEIYHEIQEKYCKDNIYSEIQTISYVIEKWEEGNEESIAVNISMVYENQEIGNYEVIFSVEGKVKRENLDMY